MKIEMRFAGGDIDQLVVERTTRSSCRQALLCFQTISAAAGDDQGPGFILERST